MDGTNVGETKQTVGGLSGLFSDSDASLAMKLVLFSGNPEVRRSPGLRSLPMMLTQ